LIPRADKGNGIKASTREVRENQVVVRKPKVVQKSPILHKVIRHHAPTMRPPSNQPDERKGKTQVSGNAFPSAD